MTERMGPIQMWLGRTQKSGKCRGIFRVRSFPAAVHHYQQHVTHSPEATATARREVRSRERFKTSEACVVSMYDASQVEQECRHLQHKPKEH